jgi:hypothetical protein
VPLDGAAKLLDALCVALAGHRPQFYRSRMARGRRAGMRWFQQLWGKMNAPAATPCAHLPTQRRNGALQMLARQRSYLASRARQEAVFVDRPDDNRRPSKHAANGTAP